MQRENPYMWSCSIDRGCEKASKRVFFLNPYCPESIFEKIKIKTNLNFHFHTSLWYLKWFCEGLYGLFPFNPGIGMGRVNRQRGFVNKCYQLPRFFRKKLFERVRRNRQDLNSDRLQFSLLILSELINFYLTLEILRKFSDDFKGKRC